MHLLIASRTPPAILLGAALQSAGHAVDADPSFEGLRVRLPSGWLTVAGGAGGGGGEADLVIRDPIDCGTTVAANGSGAGARVLFLRCGLGDAWSGDPAREGECVVSFDASADGGRHVELLEEPAVLIHGRDPTLRLLFAPLRSRGFRCVETRELAAHGAAARVARLLDLPVALCDTARRTFLASPEGRTIAEGVLEEGFRLTEKLGEVAARLPCRDPGEMLKELRRRPLSFDSDRYAPARASGQLLEAMRAGARTAKLAPQRSFLRRAAIEGLPIEWNRRLVELLPRVARVGFYRTPGDLLRAIS